MRDYEINSDLKASSFQNLKFVQFDNGNEIKVNILEEGQSVDLTGCTVLAKYKRVDGKEFNRTATVTDNKIVTILDSTVTSVVGRLKIIFKIVYDEKQVSTFVLLADIKENFGEGDSNDIGGNTGNNTEITVDLSNYYTKQEIDKKLETIKLTPGPAGENGLSAYEIAQQETGFAGSEQQWLNSLVGATPNLQIGTVETLESGSNATASITGTTENPLLNLGIPKGADGTSESSEKNWEYIETIESSEDVRSVIKNFDKEYSELYVKMFVENNSADETGMLRFKINDKSLVNTNTADFALSIGKLNSGTREFLMLNSLHPLLITGINSIATNTWQPTPVFVGLNSDTYENSPFSVSEKISKIEFQAGNLKTTFATGAKFIIYGR